MTETAIMNILGLSFDFHDSAAALVIDGVPVAAEQEERFSRKKHDAAFPMSSIECCLATAKLRMDQIDRVIFYEDSLLKFDRILSSTLRSLPHSRGYFRDVLTTWFAKRKFEPTRVIAERLGVPAERILHVDHHQSHAGSAYFCSGFPEATVVTIDGVGEYETATLSVARGNRIEKLRTLRLPDSLGLFYSAFTAFLGFEVNEGEYKVMGMAGYGTPVHADAIRALFTPMPGWGFRLRQDLFYFRSPEKLPFTQALCDWLGPPREPEAPFRIEPEEAGDEAVIASSRHYADIAASVQACAEDVIKELVESAVRITGVPNVCLAGGVALNGLANARITRELRFPLYVHPAAGDAGGALGAALYHAHVQAGEPRAGGLESALLGRAYDDDEIARELRRAYVRHARRLPDHAALIEAVSERLAGGKVVGWFQQRAEWGPRALGSRSILADPRIAEMQRKVNEKIKFREPFRPFAPAVLAERAAEFFEIESGLSTLAPENFMLSVARVRDAAKSVIPATTHVDGTSRVQLVHRTVNPLFYDLISSFADRTGVPILLNTSFNLRGEPIVGSPGDALKTFMYSGLDSLALGNFIIDK